MLKRCVLVLVCVLCATSAFAQRDAIDLSRAVVVNSPMDVASWPITSRVESMTMSPEGTANPGIAMYFNGRNTWPNYHVPGWTPGGEGLQYTIWAGVNINGVWHVSGFIQMWRTRIATGAPILTVPSGCPAGNNFSCNWAYDGRWGAMNHYVPRAGESMIFFATAGNARGVGTVTSVRERTNVVMVTLPANDTGSWSFAATQTDLLIDLGSNGMWTLLDAANYSQINPANAKSIATGDIDGNGIDEIVVDFGSTQGIWVRWNNANWTQIHSLTANSIAMGDIDRNGRADLTINFPGAGIWTLFNGSTWGQIHSMTATKVQVAKDGTMVLEFAGGGIWLRRANGVWNQIHPMQSSAIATGDFDASGVLDVVVAFPGFGVWMFRNGTNWAQLNPGDASKLVRSNLDGGPADDLVVDFGNGVGVWALRNLAVWAQVHSQSPKSVAVADLDGNGTDDIVMDFDAGAGVWVLANLSSWIHAFGSTTEGIVSGNFN